MREFEVVVFEHFERLGKLGAFVFIDLQFVLQLLGHCRIRQCVENPSRRRLRFLLRTSPVVVAVCAVINHVLVLLPLALAVPGACL